MKFNAKRTGQGKQTNKGKKASKTLKIFLFLSAGSRHISLPRRHLTMEPSQCQCLASGGCQKRVFLVDLGVVDERVIEN